MVLLIWILTGFGRNWYSTRRVLDIGRVSTELVGYGKEWRGVRSGTVLVVLTEFPRCVVQTFFNLSSEWSYAISGKMNSVYYIFFHFSIPLIEHSFCRYEWDLSVVG